MIRNLVLFFSLVLISNLSFGQAARYATKELEVTNGITYKTKAIENVFSLKGVTVSKYFNSDTVASSVSRVGNVIYGILDTYTGETLSFTKVNNPNGIVIDSVIYCKKGDEVFKRNVNGSINAKWFGAVGDSNHVDTKALQLAMITSASSGIPLYIPSGKYIVSDIFKIQNYKYVHIYGDGDNTVLVGKDTTTSLRASMFNVTSCDYAKIVNFVIDERNMKPIFNQSFQDMQSANPVNEGVIVVKSVKKAIVENIRIINANWTGFSIWRCDNATIRNNTVEGLVCDSQFVAGNWFARDGNCYEWLNHPDDKIATGGFLFENNVAIGSTEDNFPGLLYRGTGAEVMTAKIGFDVQYGNGTGKFVKFINNHVYKAKSAFAIEALHTDRLANVPIEVSGNTTDSCFYGFQAFANTLTAPSDTLANLSVHHNEFKNNFFTAITLNNIVNSSVSNNIIDNFSISNLKTIFNRTHGFSFTAITLNTFGTYTNEFKNIKLDNNVIKNYIGITSYYTGAQKGILISPDANSTVKNLSISNNTLDMNKNLPFNDLNNAISIVGKTERTVIDNNTINNNRGRSLGIGVVLNSNTSSKDVEITRNRFINCGNPAGSATSVLQVYTKDNKYNISNNYVYNDSANPTTFIDFRDHSGQNTPSNDILIDNNIYRDVFSNTAVNTIQAKVSGRIRVTNNYPYNWITNNATVMHDGDLFVDTTRPKTFGRIFKAYDSAFHAAGNPLPNLFDTTLAYSDFRAKNDYIHMDSGNYRINIGWNNIDRATFAINGFNAGTNWPINILGRSRYVDSITGVQVAIAMGFTPVQQGTGAGQFPNTVKIGWNNVDKLLLDVGNVNFGANWPINITGLWQGKLPSDYVPSTRTITWMGNSYPLSSNITLPSATSALKLSQYFDNNKTSSGVLVNSGAGTTRVGDVLFGLIDDYTGESLTFSKVADTTGIVVDSVIYCAKAGEIFKRTITENKVYVRWFGTANNVVSSTGNITSGSSTLTASSVKFVASDTGKVIQIVGAGTAKANLVTTIVSVVNSTTVTIGTPASTTVSAAAFNYGTDDTKAIKAAFNYANAANASLVFDYGYYFCDELFIQRCRVKEIASGIANLGEASGNAQKTVIVPVKDNQRFIWKFGGKDDFSSYTDLESVSTKGMKMRINFSSLGMNISKAALCLETFTSSDLEVGFYNIKGAPLYAKNYYEGNARFYFRRIDNFGGYLIDIDNSTVSVGANASELLFDKITVGESNCGIMRTGITSAFGGKCIISNLQYEENQYAVDTFIRVPTKAQMDTAATIPLFKFGYADGLQMRNINLSGLGKLLLYKDGRAYKHSVFQLDSVFNISGDISINDCNNTTYLTSGHGAPGSVMDLSVIQSVYNRTTVRPLTFTSENLEVINRVEKGFVTIRNNAKKELQYKYYPASELFGIVIQQYYGGQAQFTMFRDSAASVDYVYKNIFNQQTFLSGKTVKGLRANILVKTDATGINVQRKNGASISTITYPVTPNTWTLINADLYYFANQSDSFVMRTINSTDSLQIQYIHFYMDQSTIFNGATGQRPTDAYKFYLNNSTGKLEFTADGTNYLDVPRLPSGTTYTLGNYAISGGSLSGTAGLGFIGYPRQTSKPVTPIAGAIGYSNNSDRFSILSTNGYEGALDFSTLTGDQSFRYQNKTGTLAMTNDNISQFTNDQGYLDATTGITPTSGDLRYLKLAGGALTGLVTPSTAGGSSLGSSSLPFGNVYALNFRVATIIHSGTDITIQNNVNAVNAKIFGTTGNWAIGASPTDDATNKLQVGGNVKSTGFRISTIQTAPTSATDTGTTGEIRFTTTGIYICIATNTWIKATAATF